jgi:transposase
MFGLTPETRVFLRTGATDGRFGADALKGIVINVIREDPHARHLFCFCNKARDRVKLLWHDGGAFWVAGKRLARGVYDFPKNGAAVACMSMAQLEVLVKGVQFTPLSMTGPRRYRR